MVRTSLNRDNYNTFRTFLYENRNEDNIEITNESNGDVITLPMKTAQTFFTAKGANGIDFDRMMSLAKTIAESKIKLNKYSTKVLFKKEHSRSDKSDAFLENYKIVGNLKCNLYGSDWTKEALTEGFKAIPRFNGRTPEILDTMAAVADTYNIDPDVIVSKFDINTVRTLRGVGLPNASVVLLYTQLDHADLNRWKDSPEVLEQMAQLISKGILEDNEKYTTAARWVSTHSATDREIIDSLLDSPKMFKISSNSTVEKVRVQMSGQEALKEIKKIEKAYKKPKFKFSECKCTLKMSKVEKGQYEAYILNADDPRQVMLGHWTNCCQIYGDAGETAMLHGLLNEKAGFWGVFDTESEKLRCQAEVWEVDEDILVLDNIEFADDTELERYKEIIGEWLLTSPYKTICMGCGWNQLGAHDFEQAPDFVPSVTPREIYVMSYEEDAELPYFHERTAPNKRENDNERSLFRIESEEKAKEMLDEGRINYYDYLYADVDDDKGVVYLKKDFVLDPYFEVDLERQAEYKAKFDDGKEARMERYATVIESVLNKELADRE